MEKSMEKVVALAKARGFVYPGSEIYGGLANTWDYGNLGVELKNNVKRAWWQKFIQENPYNVGVDCAILMNPQTWVASGHLGGFSDPLMDCRECHERFRADKVIEDFAAENGIERADVERICREADFISLHTVLDDSTRHMINAERLAMMKPTAILINTARGGLIDGAALLATLKEGRIYGAGLDVFEEEPPAEEGWYTLDNLVMGSHCSSSTPGSSNTMGRMAVDNLLKDLGLA